MAFSGVCGSLFSVAGGEVAGFGPTNHATSKLLQSSMTSTATNKVYHTYVFTIVSIAFYRAVSRAKDLVSVFRTS